MVPFRRSRDRQGRSWIGVVIRDEAGRVLLSAWRAMCIAIDAEEGELLACREGLGLAGDWNRRKVIVESGCTWLDGCARQHKLLEVHLFSPNPLLPCISQAWATGQKKTPGPGPGINQHPQRGLLSTLELPVATGRLT